MDALYYPPPKAPLGYHWETSASSTHFKTHVLQKDDVWKVFESFYARKLMAYVTEHLHDTGQWRLTIKYISSYHPLTQHPLISTVDVKHYETNLPSVQQNALAAASYCTKSMISRIPSNNIVALELHKYNTRDPVLVSETLREFVLNNVDCFA